MVTLCSSQAMGFAIMNWICTSCRMAHDSPSQDPQHTAATSSPLDIPQLLFVEAVVMNGAVVVDRYGRQHEGRLLGWQTLGIAAGQKRA